ncbi:MAG: Mur ligase family protein, partial [Microgenomates group bacterium]
MKFKIVFKEGKGEDKGEYGMINNNRLKNYFHSVRRFVAKAWLDINLQLTVVGVTGSYGKTNAVRAIAEVLSAKYSVNKTDLNLDTLYNLPITILRTKIWNEVLVLEYGIDHLGEMETHLSLVKPKIAVLTGIVPVHTDEEHLRSLKNVILEKRKLVESVPADGLAIFNY